MKSSVFIAGKSIICALGEDLPGILERLAEGRICVDKIPLSLVGMEAQRPYYLIHEKHRDRDRTAETRFYDILFDTASKAIADAGLEAHEIKDLAVFFGSTSIDIPIYEDYYQKADAAALDHFSKNSYGYGSVVNETARHFGIRGPCYTFTTACTSSANACLYAASMMELGKIKKALVIGYDLFNNTGFYGFESLRLTASDTYKPFDKNRDGIIMGEACAAIILSPEPVNRDDFRYLGGANLCDTHNVTTHDPEGAVVADIIRQSMRHAGVAPGDITAIKAHATGSEMNDRMEAGGMRQVFTAEKMPPVTGLKPFIGHTVGAAGVAELILFTESVKKGFIPATPGFAVMDEELMIRPVTENLPVSTGIFILNYFGFGGNCTSLIWGI